MSVGGGDYIPTVREMSNETYILFGLNGLWKAPHCISLMTTFRTKNKLVYVKESRVNVTIWLKSVAWLPLHSGLTMEIYYLDVFICVQTKISGDRSVGRHGSLLSYHNNNVHYK